MSKNEQITGQETRAIYNLWDSERQNRNNGVIVCEV